MYISVRQKFLIAFLWAFAWLVVCTYLAYPWIQDLGEYVGMAMAFCIIALIALLPGFMNVFIIGSFLLDTRPKLKEINEWPSLSILVPAYNEEKQIQDTLESLSLQDYSGKFEVIFINNNSSDKTSEVVKNLNMDRVTLLYEKKQGKSFALNTGLAKAKHNIIVTVDADTYLLTNALSSIVTAFLSLPADTAAVAGSVYVRNSRKNLMTKLQEWDYFHSIAAIKRIQSLLQATLVAQGAFSLFKKECIQEVGGWKHTVGEDIVLSWGLIEKGYRISFAERAIAFVNVPEDYRTFFYQRSRWARGMLEAFTEHPKILVQPRLITFIVYWNFFFPAMDAAFMFIFIPGLILAFFGYYFIAGPITLALIPLAFLLSSIVFKGQKRVFVDNKLKVRSNVLGFILFALFYNILLVPAAIHGYVSEIFTFAKKWGTK